MFKSNLDKFLMTFIVIFFMAVNIYMIENKVDQVNMSWVQTQAAFILGVLAGLVQGRAAQRKEDATPTINGETPTVVNTTGDVKVTDTRDPNAPR